jgi:hypothetical protein
LSGSRSISCCETVAARFQYGGGRDDGHGFLRGCERQPDRQLERRPRHQRELARDGFEAIGVDRNLVRTHPQEGEAEPPLIVAGRRGADVGLCLPDGDVSALNDRT